MSRKRIVAKPRRGFDLRAATASICQRFSETLKYLASAATHPKDELTVEQVADAVQTAIESNTSPTYVDNLGDGESIIIDGTINLAVLTEELNKL